MVETDPFPKNRSEALFVNLDWDGWATTPFFVG